MAKYLIKHLPQRRYGYFLLDGQEAGCDNLRTITPKSDICVTYSPPETLYHRTENESKRRPQACLHPSTFDISQFDILRFNSPPVQHVRQVRTVQPAPHTTLSFPRKRESRTEQHPRRRFRLPAPRLAGDPWCLPTFIAFFLECLGQKGRIDMIMRGDILSESDCPLIELFTVELFGGVHDENKDCPLAKR